jgi:hypothetical protein
MVGNTSLRDLQPTISARLPGLLQELDDAAANRAALHAADLQESDQPIAAAFTPRAPNHNRGQRRPTFPRGKQITKFCRICFLLNKGSPNIYTSHNITNCNKLSDRDKQEMARGAAISLEDTEDHDNPMPIPGWDTDED